MEIKYDISTFSLNSVFSPYIDDKCVEPFSDYFHRNLNPDIAPSGFLEEVDRLIQIAKHREVTIEENHTTQEWSNVLQEYLNTFK